MRKKLKEYSRRFLSVFLCISLVIFFVCHPVSANSYELIDLLNFQESFNPLQYVWNYKDVRLELPSVYSNVCYIEIVYYSYFDLDLSVKAGNSSFSLEKVSLGNDTYRAFGSGYVSTQYLDIRITDGLDRDTALCFYSIEFSNVPVSPTSLPYTIYLYNRGNQNLVTDNVNAGSVYNLPSGYTQLTSDQIYGFDFTIYVSPSDWKKFDLLNIRFDIRAVSINSCLCTLDDSVLSSSLSLSSTSFDAAYGDSSTGPYSVPISHYGLSIDLSSINRSSNDFISIQVTGTYPSGYYYSDLGTIYFLTGFQYSTDYNVSVVWYRRIWNAITGGFEDIKSVIVTNWSNFSNSFLLKMNQLLDVFNGENSEASEAIQKQEEINVSVNNQLVGAVEDWNTNIEVVETGYDMAFSKTTPALSWLASLADGIFNGMGWFGNVYFLVGLISVIMLVLSKSGLAHKIGSISRRKGD